MSSFGSQLRSLRGSHGLRQQDLVGKLGGVVARSTLAGVESGHQAPSVKLWTAIQSEFSDWIPELEQLFIEARNTDPGPSLDLLQLSAAGPFAVEESRCIYTWRDHHVPEEIIEVRRVRALRDGADSYILKMNTEGEDAAVDVEVLWGGRLQETVSRHHGGRTVILNRFTLDRPLRRGEVFTFAVRTWMVAQATPPDNVTLHITEPVEQAAIHFNFLGPLPTRLWRFGPLADPVLARAPEVIRAGERPVTASFSCYFPKPVRGAEYGLSWDW